MKLPFERWLDEQEPAAEALVAFDEAVLAFKTGAYRAALMFSYVGMGLCLRRRMLSAANPAGVPEGQWTTIQKDLQDEHKWDATVFDCTQMKSPKDVFDVDDHLREEMKYWKNRRNDCAHFKRNEIGAPHVEAFWLFLSSSLGRWVPNGSKRDVLDRLVRHFDPNLTPPGADLMPIARMIPQAVPQLELSSFFDDLVLQFTKTVGKFSLISTDSVVAVFEAVLTIQSSTVFPAASAWLHQNPELLVGVLRRAPHQAGILMNQPALVRNLWRKQLFTSGHQDLPLFASLLRLSLIPGDEIQEAVSSVIDRLTGDTPIEPDERTLTAVGFWQAFHRKAIDERGIDKFEWGNRNASLIAWYIERNPLNVATASVICEAFGAPPFPFAVRDALKEMLAANPSKMSELGALASQAGVTVPTELK